MNTTDLIERLRDLSQELTKYGHEGSSEAMTEAADALEQMNTVYYQCVEADKNNRQLYEATKKCMNDLAEIVGTTTVALAEQTEAAEYNFQLYQDAGRQMNEMGATIERLREQLAAAQKDAERYRWLREFPNNTHYDLYAWSISPDRPETLIKRDEGAAMSKCNEAYEHHFGVEWNPDDPHCHDWQAAWNAALDHAAQVADEHYASTYVIEAIEKEKA